MIKIPFKMRVVNKLSPRLLFIVVVGSFSVLNCVQCDPGVEVVEEGDGGGGGAPNSSWRDRLTGWKRYLEKFDVSSIWSASGENFFGDGMKHIFGELGSQKKPAYLYSTGSIRQLARMESDIYAVIKKYEKKKEDELRLIKIYLKDYAESSVNMMKGDGDDVMSQNDRDYAVVANPIIAHRLIRRFAMDIPAIVESIDQYTDEGEEFLLAIQDANPSGLLYPTASNDYNQSLYSLLRIQRYANLNTADMANGTLDKLQTGVGLTARHAYDLGSYAGRSTPQLYALAVEWLETALDKLKGDENQSDYQEVIEEELQDIVKKHDTACSVKKWNVGMEHCFTFLIRTEFGGRRPKGGRVLAAQKNQANSADFRNITEYSLHTRRNFLNTCSGRNLQSESEKSLLFCYYEMKKHPYLIIAPMKIEQLSLAPELIQIYDILGPSRISTLIRMATPSLKRSLVVNTKDPTASDVSDVRTSSQTWIYDDDKNHAQFLDGISRQIEYITGLNVRHGRRGKGKPSEAYQVASYRTSHHYDEHMDALTDERRTTENGNRIGTFMFYLTDVDVGGKTGFPVVGTAASPTAGSAVFWHNLWRNGTSDKRTWHGGCPVVHGMKWVTNKWILAYENFDKRLCSLDRDE